MQHLTLTGSWHLYAPGDTTPIPASVPGCVHLDLLAAGRLADPFYRDQERLQMGIGETDWRYERTFTLAPDWLACDRLLLRCHGLDTLATVTVNDRVIGRADNMFRLWEFDLKPAARAGENTIRIDLAAPMPYMRRMEAEKGALAGWVEPMRISSGAWIRKQPSNFGWDWGPKLVTSGIWRAIALVGFNTARLADVAIRQTHAPGAVTLSVRVDLERVAPAPLTAAIDVSRDGQIVSSAVVPFAAEETSASARLPIPDPALWWVRGLGDQPLYTVRVALRTADGAPLDAWERQIGLRTLTLERHPDGAGETFYFACNGVPFFAKGANWIPATAYPGQAVDYAPLIDAAAAAHMNMLRVWGGGVYEEDAFYDLCDRYGIAVWQDFMFACGTYPTDDAAFMANVEAEARDTLRRLRHHPCLALWCGNNEIEQGMSDPAWLATLSWEQYAALFDRLLADLTRELAPDTAYWPGSPHKPTGDRADTLNPESGDSHLWAVWHGRQPFDWYHTRTDRFISEFGFQSLPEPATIAEFTLPEDRNLTSYVMEFHQRSAIGNSTIVHYLLDWFRLPTSFSGLAWLSQIVQGLAMTYAVEGWRRGMPRTMGALYWQLNDLWPGPSWSSIDWRGRWKALHYLARRFFAPSLVSGVVDPAASAVHVHVTHDGRAPLTGRVRAVITDAAGAPLRTALLPVTVMPGTSSAVGALDVAADVRARGERDLLIWLDLLADDPADELPRSEALVLLCRPKHLELRPPRIETAIAPLGAGEYAVTLTTDTAALYVWIDAPDAQPSDGFFHLRPGVARTVRVRTDDPARLRVRSLVDTYLPGRFTD
jgi:beta-mannosidase